MASEKVEWIHWSQGLPKEGIVVMTKIDDDHGVRNEQPLKLIGQLWFFPDGSMYVYYQPNYWKPIRAEVSQ